MIIVAKFGKIWPSRFRGEDFCKSEQTTPDDDDDDDGRRTQSDEKSSLGPLGLMS